MSVSETASNPSSAAGLSVFVVEDEALVALNLEDILADLGCSVIGPAMRVEAAHNMVDGDFAADLAILDVNVGGEMVFPVAEKLAGRGVPIIFATGYGKSGLPDAWQHCTTLQKPYTIEEVSGAISSAAPAAG